MATILNDAVTSTTVAAALEIDTAGAGMDEVRLILKNNGSVTAYLGGSSVSASAGFPLPAGEAYEWPVRVGSSIVHHVTASGTTDLRWMGLA